jgi:[ribosomal protein S5]-alanine N-acetyltransferase
MLEPNFDPFPEISTEQLVLKKITQDDVKEFFSLRSSEIVMKYIDRPLHKTLEDTQKQIELVTNLLNNNEGINWGITLKNDPTLVGTICLFNFKKEHYRGELGYILAPEFHRKGIMNEAIRAVIQYGFSQLKLHTIEAQVNPNNLASVKILEKNNFVREAYFRDYYLTAKGYIDMAIYGLVSPFK